MIKDSYINFIISSIYENASNKGYVYPFIENPKKLFKSYSNRYSNDLLILLFNKLYLRNIYWHSNKAQEVILKINNKSLLGTKIKKWCREHKEHLFPQYSNEEKIRKIKNGVYGDIIVTTMDSILHILLTYYDEFFEEDDKMVLAEKILENIYYHSDINDPCNLLWAIHTWKEEEDIFNDVINRTGNKYSDHFNYNNYIDIIRKRLSKDSKGKLYTGPKSIPVIDNTPELYGEARSTAYALLNTLRLKRIDKNSLLNDTIIPLFNWIEDNVIEYEKNLYLKALLLEVLYEYNDDYKERVVDIMNNIERKHRHKRRNRVLLKYEDFTARVIAHMLNPFN